MSARIVSPLGLQDIDQPLVRADLEVLLRVLVDKR